MSKFVDEFHLESGKKIQGKMKAETAGKKKGLPKRKAGGKEGVEIWISRRDSLRLWAARRRRYIAEEETAIRADYSGETWTNFMISIN